MQEIRQQIFLCANFSPLLPSQITRFSWQLAGEPGALWPQADPRVSLLTEETLGGL